MARQSVGFVRSPFISIPEKEIQFNDIANSIAGFNVYLQAQLRNVTQSLVAGAVTSARKKLRSAVTDWGQARMAGRYFGVSFARYGRTSGREETGFMYNSLSSKVELAPSGKTMWKGTFGWEPDALQKAPYIYYQEFGFYGSGRFDPVATAASGIASFKDSGKEKYVEGASSLRYALNQLEKRAASAYSAARNEAIKKFNADGFKGNPAKYADIKPTLGPYSRPSRFSKGFAIGTNKLLNTYFPNIG